MHLQPSALVCLFVCRVTQNIVNILTSGVDLLVNLNQRIYTIYHTAKLDIMSHTATSCGVEVLKEIFEINLTDIFPKQRIFYWKLCIVFLID